MTARSIMLACTGSLLAGLLLGAWVHGNGGWRSVAIICGVTIASTGLQLWRDSR